MQIQTTAHKRRGRTAGPTINGKPVKFVLVHAGYGPEFMGPEICRFNEAESALAMTTMWGRNNALPISLTAWRKSPKGWDCIA